LISFAIIYFAPGDPARLLIDPEIGSAEQYAALRDRLGLDEPMPIQYFRIMSSLFRGKLRSFRYHQPVIELILARLPTTLSLGSLALGVGFLIGARIGIAQAISPYSSWDTIGTFISLIGFSMPQFWLGILFVQVFAVRLHWLPASGIRPAGSSSWNIVRMLPYLVLPTSVLAMRIIATVAQYTRTSMVEVLATDYVKTARAKGIPEKRVVFVHALRNSLLPLITLLGLLLPIVVTGTVVVESIFGLPGVGRLAIDAVFSRDYPIILTITLFGAWAVISGNLLTDIAYTFVDPRVHY